MSLLSDAFPEEFRKQFAERNLNIGTVLRMYVTDTIPPKTKYFIVIGFTEDRLALGAVYVNSEINPKRFNNAYLRSLHLPMTPDDRQLVDHDCFIDCSRIIEKQVDVVSDVLESEPSCNRGELDSSELANLLKALFDARTINDKIKRKFGIK